MTLPPLENPAINRELQLLHPEFAKRCSRLIEECKLKGVAFGLFEGYRSPKRQQQLFASGRTAPGPKLTNADAWQSYHQYGIAADVVLDGDQAKPGFQWSWEDRKGQYDLMGALAEKCGLEWAGRWRRFPEKPHVQLTMGFKENELRELFDFHQHDLDNLWQEMTAGI